MNGHKKGRVIEAVFIQSFSHTNYNLNPYEKYPSTFYNHFTLCRATGAAIAISNPAGWKQGPLWTVCWSNAGPQTHTHKSANYEHCEMFFIHKLFFSYCFVKGQDYLKGA